jgi:MFS superfamily sulfate permease-like transporter
MSTKSNINKGLFSNLGSDLPASIVVFLVAVPLCLGIALASGAPLFAGIIAGIVGGIVVGAASGSPLGVSGPAAGLAVIVLTAIQDLGAFDIFLLAVVIGGLIQLVLGFARAGIIGYYFPSSVIKGMLAGIGVLIFLKQIPHAFGFDKVPEGSTSFQHKDTTTFSEIANIFQHPENITISAVIITVISLLILVLWEQKFMKKIPLFKIIQGPLVVVVLGIVLTIVFNGMSGMEISPDHMVQIPVATNFEEMQGLLTFPDFSAIGNGAVWLTGATIAVVASLETLLCVEATDKLDPYKRVTPTNRELKAQGLGNVVSGLIGGLPVTQVIVRSSANIQSGGKTKMSAIMHGFILLISALAIPFVLNMIPLASLAAILILVGYKLAKPALFKTLYKQGWTQFIPFVVTIVGIVMTDLLIGIGLGMAVAICFILYNNFKSPYFFNAENHDENSPIVLELSEDVSFLNKASILQTLNHLPEDSKVIIDATKTVHIDYDVKEIINDFKENAKFKNIELEIKGLGENDPKKDAMKELQAMVSHRVYDQNGSTKSMRKEESILN